MALAGILVGLIGALTGVFGYRLQRRLAAAKQPRVTVQVGWVETTFESFMPWSHNGASKPVVVSSLGGHELGIAVRNDGERPVDVVEVYACGSPADEWRVQMGLRWPEGPRPPVTLSTGQTRWSLPLKEIAGMATAYQSDPPREFDAGFRLELSNGEAMWVGPIRFVVRPDQWPPHPDS